MKAHRHEFVLVTATPFSFCEFCGYDLANELDVNLCVSCKREACTHCSTPRRNQKQQEANRA